MTIGFIFTILLIIIIFFIVFWLLFAYPKKYKANINKALNTGVPVKTIEPTILFGGIILITLVILNIVLLVGMSNIQDDINQLRNQSNDLVFKLNTVKSQVSNINYNIDELYQDSKWIKSGEHTIESLTDETHADITVVFEMNRIPSNGIITLVYSDEDNIVLTKVVTSTTTIFSTTISIDIDMRYELSVMIDDGTTIGNEDLFNLDIENELQGYRRLDLLFDEDNGQIMTFIVMNDYSIYSELAFEKVEVNVYLDDVVVYSDIVTQPTFNANETQTFEITLNPYEYGDGESRVSIIGTDKLGNEWEMFGEEWTIELEHLIYENQNN